MATGSSLGRLLPGWIDARMSYYFKVSAALSSASAGLVSKAETHSDYAANRSAGRACCADLAGCGHAASLSVADAVRASAPHGESWLPSATLAERHRLWHRQAHASVVRSESRLELKTPLPQQASVALDALLRSPPVSDPSCRRR